MIGRILQDLFVKDVSSSIVREPATIGPACSVDELLAKMIEDPRTRHVYVVDEKDGLIGSVRLNQVVECLFSDAVLAEKGDVFVASYRLLHRPETVADMMDPEPQSVVEDTRLGKVIEIMVSQKVNELPVVDDANRVVGEINMLEVLSGYLSKRNDGSPEKGHSPSPGCPGVHR